MSSNTDRLVREVARAVEEPVEQDEAWERWFMGSQVVPTLVILSRINKEWNRKLNRRRLPRGQNRPTVDSREQEFDPKKATEGTESTDCRLEGTKNRWLPGLASSWAKRLATVNLSAFIPE